MEKRKIKIINSNIIKNNNESVLHPNILALIKNSNNNNNIVLTKDYILNNNLKTTKLLDNKTNLNIDNRKYMLTPSVILSYESILQLYEITSIDDLVETVNDYIKNDKNFNTVNRILNSFIKNNLDDLKKNNRIIYKIIIDLFNKYYPEFEINENNENILNFLKLWFKNKNENDFYFNLFDDIKKYLS
jgi:hypothetical protein